MTRRVVLVGEIRAGRAKVATMSNHEPIRVEGDATAVAGALAGARAVRDLDEVAFAEYVDRLVALGGAAVYPDGSFTRA